MASEYSDTHLRALQRRAFDYFLNYTNPDNGLVADKSRDDSPCSIAAVGFALTCFPIAVENGWMQRCEALKLSLAALRFFANSQQSTHRHATGYRGFYYHFLDMQSGKRVWNCELSTIDTTILLYGALAAAEYFDRDTKDERELREFAETVIARADWRWAQNDHSCVALAWKPEIDFLRARWCGYNEALLLMIMALGAPEYSLPGNSYYAWCESYRWKTIYGIEYLYAGPLFIHQFPHMWLDLRGRQDNVMRERNSDYFENSRRAVLIQREYCRRNPRGFVGYNENCWGLTASDGPGNCVKSISGKPRQFWAYRARGVPFGADDGTLSPWAVVASLPFEPDSVLHALSHIESTYPAMSNTFGFHCSFNPTFGGETEAGWIGPDYFAIDQGPMVIAIENQLTGFVWKLLRKSKILQRGFEKAGFSRERTEHHR